MIDVELKTTEPMTVAYISAHGPYSQIPEAMGALYGWAAQHGLHPAGMPRGVYLENPVVADPEHAAWELQAPLAGTPDEQAPDSSDCGVKHIEPHLVASTMYRGPYETIGPVYRELDTWVAANHYRVSGPPAEIYYSDPNTTPPAEYLTEIEFPVERA
jgi:effector-binding domain-containing protein